MIELIDLFDFDWKRNIILQDKTYNNTTQHNITNYQKINDEQIIP